MLRSFFFFWGKGLHGLKVFCRYMDLPPPVKQTTYTLIVSRIKEAAGLVSEDSLKIAESEGIKMF